MVVKSRRGALMKFTVPCAATPQPGGGRGIDLDWRKTMNHVKQMGLDFNLVAEVEELVAGVDEVGRGPLCGAVVTAAVILDPNRPIIGLDDSKNSPRPVVKGSTTKSAKKR